MEINISAESKHTPILVHETFNSSLGYDIEGHSVIRTENGGEWYADLIDPTDEQVEVHKYIVRACNAFPELVEALKDAITDLACCRGNPKYPAKNATLRRCEAAIAKAQPEGKQ